MNSMTRQERFLTALRIQTPDRVPMFDFLFQQPMYEALIGRRPETYNGRDAVACALALNHDGVWLPFGGFSGYQPKFLAADIYQDEWGTTYHKRPESWPIDAPIDYPIQDAGRPPRLPPAGSDLAGPRRRDRGRPRHGPRRTRPAGRRSRAAHDRMAADGLREHLLCIVRRSETARYVFRISNEFFKEAARRSVAAGCVALWVSEDLGDSSRGFFKLEHYRQHILPPFVELVDYVAGLGVPVLLHCCGCITAYLDDLAQTKIAALHPLQRTAKMDLREIKQKYGKRFCLIGNIDSSRTLPYGTPADVAAEVREAIDIAAPGGGYILASDHSLHDGIPVENILELSRVGTEYGRRAYAPAQP